MKQFLKTLMSVLCLSLIFHGCSEDSVVTPSDGGGDTTTLDVPQTYDFESRFTTGESSVAYTGQIVRNVLIQDLKSLAGDPKSTEAQLLDLYTNNSGNGSAASIINPELQDTWDDFNGNTSRLENKIASDVLLGYGLTPDAQMKVWFAEVPSLEAHTDGSSTRYVRTDGLELNQMIGKGLLGVVAYYQGTSVYMSKIDTDDNSVSDDGDPYTAMEHHWDESFGYFGAARDYNTYADDAARKSSFDSNADGSIDYLTEYNFDWATYAAKRDIDCAGTCATDNDFTKTIMDAYLTGRALIANEGALTDIQAQRTIIVNAWEKIIAANIIHYANSVVSKIDSNSSILHAWAEMRAFAMALQYNDYKLISDSVLSSIIEDMGDVPPSDTSTYSTKLTSIVTALQTAYQFDDANIAAW